MEGPAEHLRRRFFLELLLAPEANSESCQTSNMEIFAKIVKNENSFTIFVKTFILEYGKVVNILLNWLPKL